MISIKSLFKSSPEIDLSNIKPGSLVFVWGHSLVSKIIAWYEKHDLQISEDMPSHVEVYFGSGSHQCVSAEAEGVVTASLERYIGKPYRVEVYSYSGLTVDQLMQLKAFTYSRVNVVSYDFIGLVGFLFRKIFGKVVHSKHSLFCSELVADCFYYIGLQLTSTSMLSSEQHPAAQYEGVSHSKIWTKDFEYNNLKNKRRN